jgi:uncharacterized protein
VAEPINLGAYLNDPRRPADTLRHHELQGFLFAVAAAPEFVAPSEWLPFVFGEEPAAETVEELNMLLGAVMDEYNAINDGVFAGQPTLPAGCTFAAEPLANLEPGAPISQWSRGFVRAHQWLGELWEENLPEDWDEELGAILMTLSFHANLGVATALADETGGTVEQMAVDLREVFVPAMEEYVELGRILGNRRAPGSMPPPQAKVGRNDPCPCGSGRKFKRCCGGTGLS